MITHDCFPVLDFWYNTIGVNICAANTRDKRVSDKWKIRQTEATTPEEYEQLKNDGEFIRGAAVVTGKIWRGDYVGYYLNGIDFDNSKAIEEFCSYMSNKLGKKVTINDLAERTLVEQHPDNPSKLHLYVYSTYPFKNKSSDAGKAWFDNTTMPAIEVKSTKSLMFCSPSMHKGGHRYQFLKQRVPAVADEVEQIVDEILSKYDIEYLDRKDKAVRDTQQQKHESKVVNEGSRHTELSTDSRSLLLLAEI